MQISFTSKLYSTNKYVNIIFAVRKSWPFLASAKAGSHKIPPPQSYSAVFRSQTSRSNKGICCRYSGEEIASLPESGSKNWALEWLPILKTSLHPPHTFFHLNTYPLPLFFRAPSPGLSTRQQLYMH